MGKKDKNSRKKEDNFISGARELLNSISKNKKELKELKNLELKNLSIKEKKEIKLVMVKAKKQKLEILERYEKNKENLGKVLLKRKNKELGTNLSIERKSLNKTTKEIEKIEKNLKNS